MRKLLRMVGAVVVVFCLIAAGGVFYLVRGLDSVAKTALSPVNPSALADGTYSGEFSSGRFSNQVNVTVAGGEIQDIVVAKDVTFAKPEVTAELFSRVIAAQSTDVDVVTGATVTSKAYLKAIEDALSR